jgi:YfiH family protein
VRLAEPFYEAEQHIGIDLPGARVVFTTRRGGHSSGPFASLNLGRLTGDEEAQRNRLELEQRLGVRFAYGRQAHGTVVERAVAPPDPDVDPTECDGQATVVPGLAPMVLTADCLPIALAGGGAVAMLHAGWRGLAEGVIAEGVRAVRELGGGAPALAAAIGPGAGACCYEVGDELRERFAAFGEGARNGRNLDLKAIAREQLARAGVQTVQDVGLCTICSDPSLFFSHRRDHGLTGRQAGIAWLS